MPPPPCSAMKLSIPSLIPVPRCDHRMVQFHRFHRLGHALGFAPVHQGRLAMFDIAERAGAGADIAQHQKCRGAAAPALAKVWTHRFFTDGVKFLLAHQSMQPLIRLAAWRAYFDPVRAAQRTNIRFGDNSVSCRANRHKILYCHCEERFLRRSNLMLSRRLLRSARNDRLGGDCFVAPRNPAFFRRGNDR